MYGSARSLRRRARSAAPLLLALGAACSDAPVSTAPAPALSLDRDTATAVVGAVVRFTARGGAVSWSSSDQRVATVGASGEVRALAPGLATITVASGSERATARVRVPLQRTVGAAGDTLCLLAEGAIVIIPYHALSAPTVVSVQDAFAPPPDTTLIPGTAHELAPASLAFATPAEIAVTYDSASVPAGMYPYSFHLVHLVNGAWEPVAGSGMNLDTTIVYGLVSSGGTYAAAAYGGPAPDPRGIFGIGPSGEPISHIIAEYQGDIESALTRSHSLSLARDITEQEVGYATGKWIQGDLGDLAATKDVLQAYIDAILHSVGLPATVVLEIPTS